MKSRAQRIICFVVVLSGLGYSISAEAQAKAKLPWERDFTSLSLPGEMLKNNGKDFSADSVLYRSAGDRGMTSENMEELMAMMVPSNLYYCQSGFFCKREWQLEKATHIPFRFRIGSLDDCDRLEGKH